MIQQNLHTHTIYDDGKNTPKEMAEAAIKAGFHSLGFSGHSILPFKNDWSMTEKSEGEYRASVKAVKEEYADRLTIFCGLEWDLLSAQPASDYDYIIGAIHHIELPVSPPPSVDESPDVTKKILEEYYPSGSVLMAETYFSQYQTLAKNDKVDIIAHFDLLTKFDEKYHFFDPSDPRYTEASLSALDLLVDAEKIFEVNTGAMSRGWRTSPYPSAFLLQELKKRNARILVSSDAHGTNMIAHAFPETEKMLKDFGFRERWEYTPNGFKSVLLP